MGKPMSFLMQWRMYFDFDIVPDAPSPFDPHMDLVPELKDIRHYNLFVNEQIYFFGNLIENKYNTYVCCQRRLIPIRRWGSDLGG